MVYYWCGSFLDLYKKEVTIMGKRVRVMLHKRAHWQ